MKMIIISPGALTIPAINGGAVETLIDLYLDYNEINLHNEIIVFANYEKNNNVYKKYEYTKFEYINKNSKIFKIKRVIYGVLNKLSMKKLGNAYINAVKKICKKKYKFVDKILIENMPEYVLPINRLYGKKKIVLHQHNDFLNTDTPNSKEIIEALSKIIVVSNFVKSKILEINSTANIEVLYNGVDLTKFYKEKKQKKNIVIGYVGRIVPEKGLRELIEAIKIINKKNIACEYSLNIIGGNKNGIEDTYCKECKKIAKDEKNIHFLGYKDNSLLNEEYCKIDVSIVPSIIDDACPLSVIESIVSGCALICTNSGGIPELVSDNAIIIDRSNIINDLADKIEYLLNNCNKIEKMKEKSRNYAIQYDSSNYCLNLNNNIK